MEFQKEDVKDIFIESINDVKSEPSEKLMDLVKWSQTSNNPTEKLILMLNSYRNRRRDAYFILSTSAAKCNMRFSINEIKQNTTVLAIRLNKMVVYKKDVTPSMHLLTKYCYQNLIASALLEKLCKTCVLIEFKAVEPRKDFVFKELAEKCKVVTLGEVREESKIEQVLDVEIIKKKIFEFFEEVKVCERRITLVFEPGFSKDRRTFIQNTSKGFRNLICENNLGPKGEQFILLTAQRTFHEEVLERLEVSSETDYYKIYEPDSYCPRIFEE